jgi:hypothetical protein
MLIHCTTIHVSSFSGRLWVSSWLVLSMTIGLFGFQVVQSNNDFLPMADGMYTPMSSVMDVAALDLDIRDISNFVSTGNFVIAKKLYELGANSRPVAEVNLTTPSSNTLPSGTILTGYALDTNEPIKGTLKDDLSPGDDTLEFVYDVSNYQPGLCRVGVLPGSMQELEGCLKDVGVLDIEQGGASLSYTYNHLEGNWNGRSIQEFSVNAKDWMHDCSSCPYKTFEKFYNYYGVFDYADAIISAAFGVENNETQFSLGNLDFSLLGATGRTGMWNGNTKLQHWMMC